MASFNAAEFRRRLFPWFAANRRELPWRRNRTPYSVWISEIMLQQTVVATVIPYFTRWMRSWPDVHALAAASEREILRAWEGLGYYSRARNLLKAARKISGSGGKIPGTYEELVELPGIGDYTASAILSLAYGKPYPVLDANVRRVVQRILLLPEWNRTGEVEARSLLAKVIPAARPGRFNEAMMELGALVCVPKNPRCDVCPVVRSCLARAKNRQDAIPARRKKSVTELSSDVWLTMHHRHILVRRRTREEIGSGLWGFPEGASPDARGDDSGTAVSLPSVTHTFTRYRRRLHPRFFLASARFQPPDGCRWIPLAQLEQLPFPSAYRRILLALHAHLDNLNHG